MEHASDEFVDLDLSTPTSTPTIKAVESIENPDNNITNIEGITHIKDIVNIENTEYTDNINTTSGTTTPTHNDTLGNDKKIDPSGQSNNSSYASNLSSDKEKFAKGLSILLKPVIEEMDNRIVAVKTSQLELNKEIERLLAGI